MTTTEQTTGLIYTREGSITTDLMGTPRGEGFDLSEEVIATYLDTATGEVFLKTFNSARFGWGEEDAKAYADRYGLTVCALITGERNDTMGTVSVWTRA